MPQIIVTTRTGEAQVLSAEPGQSVMAVIRDSGIPDIEAICGGSCACATCHVYISQDFIGRLPPVTEDELVLLEGSEHYRAESSRLSCQIQVSEALDGLALRIAPEG
jgi:2Fe-2S ferredoxin